MLTLHKRSTGEVVILTTKQVWLFDTTAKMTTIMVAQLIILIHPREKDP
jgi:hypothetical protein